MPHNPAILDRTDLYLASSYSSSGSVSNGQVFITLLIRYDTVLLQNNKSFTEKLPYHLSC